MNGLTAQPFYLVYHTLSNGKEIFTRIIANDEKYAVKKATKEHGINEKDITRVELEKRR
ncbi:hypothetical protein [Paenibacillus cremeus]|uniref:hypothetical protein n=1 Tax=Paenibacillus cremeus TaxID=2163881 RepID=UPI0016449850|nr:hypothetical protein [Paenibacillus cremeus]